MIYKKSYTRVTLGLDIIQKMQSGKFKGFHELGIIKHQINLHDTLAVSKSSEMKIVCNKPFVPLDNRNICWKAADVFKDHFGISENISIDIVKNIPVQGGLAGGSTNAATLIMLLCELWDIDPDIQTLISLGRKIGMDVPYYFKGKTAFDTESTGILETINTNMKFTFVLVMPPFGISTKDAYGKIDYSKIALDIDKTDNLKKSLIDGDLKNVIQNMHNDFEKSVFKFKPKLNQIKSNMLECGCLNVILSGSGSTMLGIVENYETGKDVAKNIKEKTLVVSSL